MPHGIGQLRFPSQLFLELQRIFAQVMQQARQARR